MLLNPAMTLAEMLDAIRDTESLSPKTLDVLRAEIKHELRKALLGLFWQNPKFSDKKITDAEAYIMRVVDAYDPEAPEDAPRLQPSAPTPFIEGCGGDGRASPKISGINLRYAIIAQLAGLTDAEVAASCVCVNGEDDSAPQYEFTFTA